jgi:hypothetical protein
MLKTLLLLLQNEYEKPDTGLLVALSGGTGLIGLAIALLVIIGMWKIFTKAGQPGWAAIIPIYNWIVLLQIVGRPLWWILVLLVCFPVGYIIVCIDLAKSFGKDVGYGIGLFLLGIIFFPMLGFGSAQYVGPSAAAKN